MQSEENRSARKGCSLLCIEVRLDGGVQAPGKKQFIVGSSLACKQLPISW